MSRNQRYRQPTSAGREDPEMARIEQRTFSLETNFKDLSSDLAAVDAKFSTQLANIDTKFSSQLNSVSGALSQQIAGLGGKLDDRSKPNWMLLIGLAGVIITFMTVIGGLAYSPIQATINRVELDILRLRETSVPTRELDARALRTAADMARLGKDIDTIEARQVNRVEHEEKWRSQLIVDQNFQRQLEDVNKKLTDIYPINGVMRRFEKEIDELRAKVNTAR